jgi:hypothetical protein
VAVKLDELTHYTVLSKHLRDREHQVGCGDALTQFSLQSKANHLGTSIE